MPIETQRTVTATSPHKPEELVSLLKAEAKHRLQAAAHKAYDVVRTNDQELIRRAMLLNPVGVVLSHKVTDRITTVLFHNADGNEIAIDLMSNQIGPAS